jgi:Arabinose efflux permease
MSSPNPHKKQLAIIFFTVFIYLVGFGIVIPIIPILSRNFGATALQTGLLLSVYSLMQFLFSPFWGKLSDRYGRRPILIFCLLGEGFSYIMFAYARNLELLFLARVFAGFFGASLSTASAYISDITPPNERSKGMALIGAAFGLGFVFGPAIGGALALWGQHISPEVHFDTTFSSLWVAGICFANFLFALKFLTESLKEKNKNPTKKKRFSLLYHHLQIKTVGPLMVVFLLSSLAMSSMEATLILFMGEKFGWGIKQVSFGFAYIGVIIIFTQGFLVRRMLPKFGEKKVLRLGLILFALGLTGIAIAPNLAMMCVTMTLLSLGNGLTNPSILGSISILTDAKEQGVTMGVTQSMASLGRILGPALGGWIYGAVALTAPFWVSGTLAAAGLIIVFVLYKQLPEHGKTATGNAATSTAQAGDEDLKYNRLGYFQFNNLTEGRVPFLLVNMDNSDVLSWYKSVFKMHLENNSLNISANEVLAEVQKRNLHPQHSIIILDAEGTKAPAVVRELEKAGFINVFYIQGGYAHLAAERSQA